MGSSTLYPALLVGLAVATVLGFPSSSSAQTQNPPPAAAFVGYDRYEFLPVAMGSPSAGNKGKEQARAKVQGYIDAETLPILAEWNRAAADCTRGQGLVFAPRIERIRVVSPSARFWGGIFTGDSHVVMRLRIGEHPGGSVLGEPEFTQRIDNISGAYSFGADDQDVLRRVVTVMNAYLRSNYREAIGGPTGRDAR